MLAWREEERNWIHRQDVTVGAFPVCNLKLKRLCYFQRQIQTNNNERFQTARRDHWHRLDTEDRLYSGMDGPRWRERLQSLVFSQQTPANPSIILRYQRRFAQIEGWNTLLQNIQPVGPQRESPFQWFFPLCLPQRMLMQQIVLRRQIQEEEQGELVNHLPEGMLGYVLQFSDIREGIRVYQLVSRLFRREVANLLRLMHFAEDERSRAFLQQWR
jgi:hypothetical protein